MEGWLSWLTPGPPITSVLDERRPHRRRRTHARLRTASRELLDEEASLLEVLVDELGRTGGALAAARRPRRRARLPPRAALRASSPCPRSPSTPVVDVRPPPPLQGDPARLAAALSDAARARPPRSSARRRRSPRPTSSASLPARASPRSSPRRRRRLAERRRRRRCSSGGFAAPGAGVVVWADADVTGRRAVHRPPRPRSRAVEGFFDDLVVGSFVVHRHHGVARFGGVTTRELAGTSRDYLILEFRGTDRLYLPTDQIDVDHGVLGRRDADALEDGRRGLAAHDCARAARRRGRSPTSSSRCTATRAEHRRATRSPPTRHGSTRSRRSSRSPRPSTSCARSKTSARTWRRRGRWTASSAPTSASARPRSAIRAVFKCVQDAKQAAVLVPTTLLASQHFQTFSDRYAGYPVRVELLSRFLTGRRGRRRVVAGVADGTVDVVIGTHRLLVRAHRVQGPRAPRRRRGAALRRHAQGGGEAPRDRASTC